MLTPLIKYLLKLINLPEAKQPEWPVYKQPAPGKAHQYICLEGNCQNGYGKLLVVSYKHFVTIYQGTFLNGWLNGQAIVKSYWSGSLIADPLQIISADHINEQYHGSYVNGRSINNYR